MRPSSEQIPADLDLQLIDSPRVENSNRLRIEQAWLPMLLIEDVGLLIQVRTGLSTMERFVLEALLVLGTLRPNELEEIAPIPSRVGAWLLASLEQKGLAKERPIGVFEPRRETAEPSLLEGQVVSTRIEVADFLWFPKTGEAVVLEVGSSTHPIFRGLTPSGSWPMPSEVQKREIASILTKMLDAERVYGPLSSTIVEIVDSRRIERDLCPAYICTATAPSFASDASWNISFGPSGHQDGDLRRSNTPLQIGSLPGVEAEWRETLRSAEKDVLRRLESDNGLELIGIQPEGLRAKIRKPTASQLRKTQLLRNSIGLRVRIKDEIVYNLPLELVPADEDVKAMFDFDREVAAGIVRGEDRVVLPSTSRGRIYDRLWELRLFGELYELRAIEDFSA